MHVNTDFTKFGVFVSRLSTAELDVFLYLVEAKYAAETLQHFYTQQPLNHPLLHEGTF